MNRKINMLALALALAVPAAFAQEGAPAAEAAPATAATPAVEAAPAVESAATDAATQTVETPSADATTAAVADAGASPAAAVGTGRIVFFRPKKFAGGAVRFKVREGDSVLGKLGSGTFFVADVPAGTHEYYAKSEGKDDTLVLEVEAGETYYVMGTISMGVFAGQGNLSPSDQAAYDEAGKKKLKDVTGQDIE